MNITNNKKEEAGGTLILILLEIVYFELNISIFKAYSNKPGQNEEKSKSKDKGRFIRKKKKRKVRQNKKGNRITI